MDKKLLKASAPNSKSSFRTEKTYAGEGGFIQPLPGLCCRTAGLNRSNLMITYCRPMSVDGLVTTTNRCPIPALRDSTRLCKSGCVSERRSLLNEKRWTTFHLSSFFELYHLMLK